MKKRKSSFSFLLSILMIVMGVCAGGILSCAGSENRDAVSVSLSASSWEYALEDEITIHAIIENRGAAPIRNVTVSCGVPQGFSLINGTVNAASFEYIAAGASKELVYCIKYPGKACKVGDLDDDDHVRSTDARLALRASAGLEQLSDEQMRKGDTNGDGTVSAADARAILRVSAGLDRFATETILLPAPDSLEYQQDSYLPASAAMLQTQKSIRVNGNLYDIGLYAKYDGPETTGTTTAPTTTAPSTTSRVDQPAPTTAKPTTEPTTEPSTEPKTEPGSELSSEPISEPSSEPSSEPISEPVSEPSSEPEEPTTEEEIAWYTNLVDGGVEIAGIAKKEKSGNYVIPSEIRGQTVVGIGEDAFRYEDIRSIEIPDTVCYIGNGAFYSADGLTEITIPASVTFIDTNAFTDCDYLASVYIEGSEIEIASYAFSTQYQRKVDLTIYAPISTDLAFRARLEWGAGFVEWNGEEDEPLS